MTKQKFTLIFPPEVQMMGSDSRSGLRLQISELSNTVDCFNFNGRFL